MSASGCACRANGALPALALFVSLAATACSSSMQVERVVAPDHVEGMTRGGRLAPVAIVRGAERREIPPDARIAANEVAIPNAHGVFVYKLRPGDVIEVGGDDRISAVRGADGSRTVFLPGTAYSPEGTDEVRGQLARGETKIPLLPGDRIALDGVFESDEPIPGGGHVETSRSTFALVAGGFVWAIAYAPSFYVGVTSGHKGDRALVAPLAGPWIDLATRGKCVPPEGLPADLPVDPCAEETANRVGIIASGIAQALGGVLFVVGLPSHTEVVEDAPAGHARAPKIEWHVVPTAGAGRGGIGVQGLF